MSEENKLKEAKSITWYERDDCLVFEDSNTGYIQIEAYDKLQQELDDARNKVESAQSLMLSCKKELAVLKQNVYLHKDDNYYFNDVSSARLRDYERLKEELEKARVEIEQERTECLEFIDERDFREDQINDIADYLGDHREWSNINDRGENCIESISALQKELAAEKAKSEKLVEQRDFLVNTWDARGCGFKDIEYEIKRLNRELEEHKESK